MTSKGQPRMLLTIGHSYVVAVNRRLANEMERIAAGRWSVTVVAPTMHLRGLQRVTLQPDSNESSRLVPVSTVFGAVPQLMIYSPKLWSVLRGAKWDLIHCWEEPFTIAGAQVALFAPKPVPFIFSTFQNLVKHYPPPFTALEQYCLRRSSAWIAHGEMVREAMLERGYLQERGEVIPVGVDIELFRSAPAGRDRVRAALGWNTSDENVVGYLGRFVEEKGLRLLAAALDQLRGSWRALIVGGGPLESWLRGWAAHHGDRVKVVTGVAHDRVPSYLNAMDVLCAPSQTTPAWKEQLGRMLIEAFACGVPVIASDSGEIPFVVGDAGVVLPEGDVAAWSTAIERLLGSPEARQDLSARGLARVHERFAWNVVARRHLALFDRVVDIPGMETP
jgi:phosphatidyl-myo-inositol dimannoside synthase